jgi:SAM-dependent methyltransferase
MATKQSEIHYADWCEWEPKAYLAEYYVEVMPDEQFAMEFLVESLRKTPPVSVALDFGCGPTVHHIFPVVPQAQGIHLAEYLPANRAAVERWLAGRDDAHDWRPFTRETLRLEGNPQPTEAEVEAREQEARARITCVLPGDAGDADPLGPDRRGFYPLVTTHYCAEGATDSKETWRAYMRNIAGLVKPGGVLVLSACGAADFYCVGDRYFPCAGINGQDVLAFLNDNGFTDIDLRIRQVPGHSEQGYSSVIFARAVKAGAPPVEAEPLRHA